MDGPMKDDQRVSLESNVCVTPCRPAGASELCAEFAQHNLPVAFRSYLIPSKSKEELKFYFFFGPNYKYWGCPQVTYQKGKN